LGAGCRRQEASSSTVAAAFPSGCVGSGSPIFLDLGPMDVAPPTPTPQRFTPLWDLSSELAAGVLDLGCRVLGLPPILPFVLREIGGVAMAGNFRVRHVLIRPLYSPSALGRQASPPWPTPRPRSGDKLHRHGQIRATWCWSRCSLVVSFHVRRR
jgi:hypothetical protein